MGYYHHVNEGGSKERIYVVKMRPERNSQCSEGHLDNVVLVEIICACAFANDKVFRR